MRSDEIRNYFHRLMSSTPHVGLILEDDGQTVSTIYNPKLDKRPNEGSEYEIHSLPFEEAERVILESKIHFVGFKERSKPWMA